ncbi:hypothetical protein DNTS_030563 [Danionella cerebrum]|uniref:L-type lectin-like domain-containing protein n=1 Tax=Danionella cerebrum TaxID=2873325 RepID=A0A553NWE7_9TELE|nr:hypothetical protein DNTS_030563 [Danionella translucida]
MISLVLFAAFSIVLCDDGHEMEEFLKREFTLTKPYQDVGVSGSSHWELMGDALVSSDFVRLTPDQQSRQGAIWSRIPCDLTDWELQVHFRIHGQGKKNLNGDGLALWYTQERMKNGSEEEIHSTGTALMSRIFPYVLAMVGNGSISYDHDRDGRPMELGGCNSMVRNQKQETFLFIRYVRRRLTSRWAWPKLNVCCAAAAAAVQVMVDVDGQQEWKDCLDVPGVHLPRGFYFGASAITGDLSDNHDLISMKLYQLTILRSKQENEEMQEVQIPSVDNMELLQRREERFTVNMERHTTLSRPWSRVSLDMGSAPQPRRTVIFSNIFSTHARLSLMHMEIDWFQLKETTAVSGSFHGFRSAEKSRPLCWCGQVTDQIQEALISEEPVTNVSLFFTILFTMLGLFLLLVISLVLYEHWSERRRKRLY